MDVNLHDDPESPDATPVDAGAGSAGAGFDLSPRTGPDTARRRSSGRKWFAIGGLAVVVLALGFVLFRGLNDAAMFFYNVDEAVERRDELADKRIRMQGNVVYGSVETTDTGVTFDIQFHDVTVPVVHKGTPPELFGPEIPVVIEGTFDGDSFASDEILVKHDNVYEEENEDRIREAEDDVENSSGAGGSGAGTDGSGGGPPGESAS